MSENGSPGGGPPAKLNSWKEIAAYFGKEVRTVQNWEKEGMPVHRHMHLQRNSVYAYAGELERWWKNKGASLQERAEVATKTVRTGGILLRWKRPVAASFAVSLLSLALWAVLKNPHKAPEPLSMGAIPILSDRPQSTLQLPVLGDLDGDGKDDAVLSDLDARAIYIQFGARIAEKGATLPREADVVLHTGENADFYAQVAADVNGDGVEDLLVSALLREPDHFRRTGSTYIVWGRKQWPRSLTMPDQADVILQVKAQQDIRIVAWSPTSKSADLNGDGIGDVILGASDYSPRNRASAGAVFILFGRRKWERFLDIPESADVVIHGSRIGEALNANGSIGDFNGDGLPDLAVLASEDTLWGMQGGGGRVYLFLGRQHWPSALDAAVDYDMRVDGVAHKTKLLVPVLSDVNGDGRADLITGWPWYPLAPPLAGELNIWFGGTVRKKVSAIADSDVAITGFVSGTGPPTSLAATDIDADGLHDLLIARNDSGEISILYGRRDWKPRGAWRDYSPVSVYQGRGTFDRVAIGDWDGDGLPELLFGEASRNSERGQAWLLNPRVQVALDVRPTFEPNILYLPQGLLVARMLSSAKDPGQNLDPATIRLAGAAPREIMQEDFNGDGIPDVQAYFRTEEMAVSETTKRVLLTGRTRSGLPAAASDSVVVIKAAAPSHPASN